MPKAAFLRPNPAVRDCLQVILAQGGWELIDLDRPDGHMPSDLDLVLISTVVDMAKEIGTTTTALNMEWRHVVAKFRQTHQTLPVALVTSIPTMLFDTMIKQMLQVVLEGEVNLIKIEQGAEHDPKLGLPNTFVMVGSFDIDPRQGEVNADLICSILKAHVAGRRSA